MGMIQVLPFAVANRIAAGEVVERPASAIKELVENAIDAGAHRIVVEIQNGGMTFMRVTDAGDGMTAEDLPMCIRRHATSKISSAADLDSIITLGFRGEALAAIASVSEMRILSRRRDAEMGNVLEASQGNLISVRETGCMVGTTVIVEELFASVPARRKFMRRDATEAQAVITIVEKIALSRPDIAFQLIVDGNRKLQTAGDGNLKAAIYAVFGKEFANRMIEVRGSCEGVDLWGYISRPDFVRGSRSAENFFINGRCVRSAPAAAALEQAYHSFMPTDKFPCCVLNLTIRPELVDFNVLPAKHEVKFSRESSVFTVIYTTVRSALAADETRPELHFAAPKKPTGESSEQKPSAPARRVSDAFVPVRDRVTEREGGTERGEQMTLGSVSAVLPAAPAAPVVPPVVPPPADTLPDDMPPAVLQQPIPTEQGACSTGERREPPPPEASSRFVHMTAEQYARDYLGVKKDSAGSKTQPTVAKKEEAPPVPPAVAPAAASPAQPPAAPVPPPAKTSDPTPQPTPSEPQPQKPIADWRIVGEVFHSYIIVETGDKMLVIDQHAAHERLLYEQLRARLHETAPTSQLLLIPLEVMMMSDEVTALSEYQKELEAIGFAFTTSRNTVEVTALPEGVSRETASDMLCTIADRIKTNTGNARLTRDILFERALYQGACKAAIKAGRQYAPEHLHWLVEQLMKLPDITVCPHGRPVAMQMSKQNLDHQFERS